MAALAAFAGAYIRGFTGFGANLIWAPVLVSVMDPVQAVAIMGLVGMVGTVQIAIPAAKDANWKEILPIVLASWITVPFGIWALYLMEAENVRRVIGIFILLIAFILMTGWRYHGDRTGIKGRLAQATTGGIGGWLAGFGGIGGPVLVLYFMASTAPALIQRANNVIGVSSLIPVVIGILIYKGAITEIILIQSAILFFPFTVGTWLGAHSFTLASPIIFRKIVLVLLIIIGIFALGL
jgi:uncharacterized membrane protein YfcA